MGADVLRRTRGSSPDLGRTTRRRSDGGGFGDVRGCGDGGCFGDGGGFVDFGGLGTVAAVVVVQAAATPEKDFNDLNQAARDKAHFHSESTVQSYSLAYQKTPGGEAVLIEDLKFIDGMQLDATGLQPWLWFGPYLVVPHVSTGEQNYYLLKHATSNIEITRGGRKDNKALLLHDLELGLSLYDQIPIFLEIDVSFTTLNDIASLKLQTCQGIKFKLIPVLKEGQMDSCIAPVHTADINPNAAYLKDLVSVKPNFSILDMQNWLGSQVEIEDESGVVAPASLRKKLKMAPMVNAKAQNGMTALHMAAERGHEELRRMMRSYCIFLEELKSYNRNR
ncbi:unnamed protein product [Toxocara canis]|uniref:Uncharacterized protein n=1 Tax=Toxocara canis TaxID=6265 RepID=A0A3P7GZF3_TOXCA|nr:unnamed protein product [Toxocara canis]